VAPAEGVPGSIPDLEVVEVDTVRHQGADAVAAVPSDEVPLHGGADLSRRRRAERLHDARIAKIALGDRAPIEIQDLERAGSDGGLQLEHDARQVAEWVREGEHGAEAEAARGVQG